MTAHPPPVPPDQRSDKGPEPGQRNMQPNIKQGGEAKSPSSDPKTNQSGAVKQNTTNQGYQQDR